MNPLIVPSLIDMGKAALERLWPDASAAERARLELALAELEKDFQARMAQIGVNEQEAQSRSIFTAGWRPAVGWICVVAYAWTYLLYPLIAWTCFFIDPGLIPPRPVTDALLTELLFGLLGLGGLRTLEKIKGVAR
jgi:hypothetical protein